MSAVRESLPPLPPAFASCLLLIKGPWRRRSVPWSRFKILSDCCTRERGWGRAVAWPLITPPQVMLESLCDVMMASPGCPCRAIFRPRRSTSWFMSLQKKTRTKTKCSSTSSTSSSQNLHALIFFSSFPLLNVENKWAVVFYGLRQICFSHWLHFLQRIKQWCRWQESKLSHWGDDWIDVEQTFALKHDYLLTIKLSELIWSICWLTN